MALSSSSSSSMSVSSLRSSAGHNFPSTRLTRIEESKYEKHQHHQQQQHEEQRRTCFFILILTLSLLGLWYLLARMPYSNTSTGSSSTSTGSSILNSISTGNGDRGTGDDQLIQSLRRNPRHSPILSEEQNYHGAMYQQQQQQQPMQQPPIKARKSREERLDEAIQELKKYQADAETREREYQQEIKAQLEDELKILETT